jgi:uncharacterized protein YkwD
MNTFKPSMLRIFASAAMLSLLPLGLTTVAEASTGQTSANISIQVAITKSPASDSYTNQILTLINQKRAAVGSAPVKWNQSIGNISQDWADHLGQATKDPNFDWAYIHRSDAGGSLLPKGATWYRENIGFNGSAQQIVDWWMNSPGHKAAMLDPKATDIGIGYIKQTAGPYAGLNQVVTNLAAYPNNAPAPAFNDLSGNIFVNEITWMKNSGITTGYADGSYRPYDTVNREQMAAFMYRMAGSPAFTPPAVSPFVDVPTNHYFYKEIAWMRTSGVSTGWADGTYRPYEPVLREAMSAFMHRYSKTVCSVDVPANRYFNDSNTSVFAGDIAWMGGVGITTGYADGSYRPFDNVTREQMAAFMYRLNNHIVSNGGCR